MNKDFSVVDENIFKLYNASTEAKNLLNESKRKIKVESTSWSARNAKSLTYISLQVIANHFTGRSVFFTNTHFIRMTNEFSYFSVQRIFQFGCTDRKKQIPIIANFTNKFIFGIDIENYTGWNFLEASISR